VKKEPLFPEKEDTTNKYLKREGSLWALDRKKKYSVHKLKEKKLPNRRGIERRRGRLEVEKKDRQSFGTTKQEKDRDVLYLETKRREGGRKTSAGGVKGAGLLTVKPLPYEKNENNRNSRVRRETEECDEGRKSPDKTIWREQIKKHIKAHLERGEKRMPEKKFAVANFVSGNGVKKGTSKNPQRKPKKKRRGAYRFSIQG